MGMNIFFYPNVLCSIRFGRTYDEKRIKGKEVFYMVTCPNCGTKGENEKFCSNCGTPLDQESASTVESSTLQDQAPKAPNETVEKLKATSQHYGGYLLQIFKQPSSAKLATDKDFISGIISVGIYVILYALFYYFNCLKDYSGMKVSFLDYFVMPLLAQLILLAVIPVLIFGALTLLKSDTSIQSVIAQFGSYLIPFIAVYLVGDIFDLLDVHTLAYIGHTIGDTGVMLIVPALILYHNLKDSAASLDYIYVIFIVVALVLLVNDLIGGMYSGAPTPSYDDMFNDLDDIFG